MGSGEMDDSMNPPDNPIVLPPNHCPECGKGHETYGELIDHYWNVHDGDNPALKDVRR